MATSGSMAQAIDAIGEDILVKEFTTEHALKHLLMLEKKVVGQMIAADTIKKELTIETSPISAAQLGGVSDLIASGEISGRIAKDLFEILWTEGGEPAEIVVARGIKQVSGLDPIETALDEIIAANPAQVERAKAKPKLAGWFVGKMLKAPGGKANPVAVNELVAKKLGL